MFDEKTKQKIVELRKSGMKPKEIDIKLNLHNVQGVREVCSKRGVSEPIKLRNKEEWLEKLTIRAEAYWNESKNNKYGVPRKGSLPWLLIPKFGLDMTQKMLAVQTYLKGEPLIKKMLFGVE